MTVTIELLGYQKTAAGVGTIEYRAEGTPSAADALQHVVGLYPATYLEPERVIFNINGQRAESDTLLKDGDTLRFLPIIGGG